ncbi:MAG TPA: PHP domain-containing protein [Gemmatimonadales bacterium]|nr:PHP domain-containing protein [Gemmatimonadales bacterium]
MDGARAGVPPLTGLDAAGPGPVDLHVHSTASDGSLTPAAVVERARLAGLSAIALTDHDTVAGVPAAIAAGEALGVRVVGGCEFSCAAPWGEMHVLGYFLPADSAELEDFLERRRADRVRRGREMVSRLQALGVQLDFEDVLRQAKGGAVGRPHVARAIVRSGAATDIHQAFDHYLGRGRPAYVDKILPSLREVAELVHGVGGIVSAAHLKDRATRAVLERFREDGLDAVEVRHPSHSPEQRARLTGLANALRLGRSGGSDWHGDQLTDTDHATIGSQQVPAEWLELLAARRPAHTPTKASS